jgi:hypothetical protein
MQKSEIGDDERVSSGSESIWKEEMGQEHFSFPLSNPIKELKVKIPPGLASAC